MLESGGSTCDSCESFSMVFNHWIVEIIDLNFGNVIPKNTQVSLKFPHAV